MFTQERYNEILKIVDSRRAVTVAELASLLDASESTIRRDLTALDKEKRLHKVHGGATALEREYVLGEEDMSYKQNRNIAEKEAIAIYAASTIQDHDFVFIDAGSTTEQMLDHITNTTAVYMTNGIDHARILAGKGLKVYVTGGLIKSSTGAIVGSDTLEYLKKYNFTKSFLGTNGISVEQGFTTTDPGEAAVKTRVMAQTYVSYVLADHTKFDKVCGVTFGQITETAIITDKVPRQKYSDITFIKEVGSK